MKIDGRKGPLNQGVDPVGAPRSESGPGVGGAAAGDDRVSLSARARELAGLRAGVGDLAAIRPEKVAALRDAVAAGSYQVAPAAVARALLRELGADLLA